MSLRPPDFDPADAADAAARFAASAPADIFYAVVDSPVGILVAATTAKGLVRLSYAQESGVDPVLETLARRLSPRILEAPMRLDGVRREIDEYFAGRRMTFDLPVDLTLVGPFTQRVLRATARIPFGETSTYGAVAARAGAPRGARAAGNALGANPIPIVIPCHRVLRTGGAIGGYTGGLDIKRTLLAVEGHST
jgi:methylated-DNA-[protein]-cysteine S-methyltransferase